MFLIIKFEDYEEFQLSNWCFNYHIWRLWRTSVVKNVVLIVKFNIIFSIFVVVKCDSYEIKVFSGQKVPSVVKFEN